MTTATAVQVTNKQPMRRSRRTETAYAVELVIRFKSTGRRGLTNTQTIVYAEGRSKSEAMILAKLDAAKYEAMPEVATVVVGTTILTVSRPI